MPFKSITGGITAPRGFKASGVACGIKKGEKLDLAVVFSEEPSTAAGVFTQSALVAAPVLLSRAAVENGVASAVVINSGNANACTGKQGYADAVIIAETTARQLGVCAENVVVASTGVIGVPLPIEKIVRGIEKAAGALSDGGSARAAEAILTTDTFAKECAVEVQLTGGTVRIGGIAKGSGMIAPNMATMLAFITTDAAIHADELRKLLEDVTDRTFNSITVDGDTSTNDMAIVLANGASGVAVEPADLEIFADALEMICVELAKLIVKDGEGATKFIEVAVVGAKDGAEAKTAALAIANSNLVKTAMFGADANWGRVAAAAGYSGAMLDPDAFAVTIGGVRTVKGGTPIPFDETEAAEALSKPEITLEIDLGVGDAGATVWTCDLSYDYIRINADYRT